MGFFGIDDRHCARALVLAPLVASALAMSGCVSSPTYGTDKTAAEQLFSDINNVASFAPNQNKIDYKPRPPLVKPAPGEKESLPAPQEDITQTASAGWPESPEQRRARLRADAAAHENDVNYDPQIVDDVQTDPVAVRKAMAESGSDHPPPPDSGKDVQRRGEINRRLVEANQGDPTSRKYLSEPPLTYRSPAATAPQGELGEDEVKKERRLKKEAAAKSGKGSGMFDWLPW